jgi:ABC-type lipoprotein export system ATPase subunit
MILDVDHLTLSHGHGIELRDISFKVDENECVSIHTPILLFGTSLLQGLIGMLDEVSGKVWFQGINLIGPLPMKRLLVLRQQIGFVHRIGGLISLMNVRENIALPLGYHRNIGRRELNDTVIEIAERLAIQDLLDLEVDQLDIGQTRMVNLARALIARPRLLLIDAILEGMSGEQTQRVIQAIRACQAQTRCGVVMTNRGQSFDLAGKIFRLEQGRLDPISA